MKKLYGYQDAVEAKMDYITKAFEADDKAEIKRILGSDPYEISLGEMILKYVECAFGIPEATLKKPLVDLTIGEIAILDEIESRDIITFSRS